MGVWKNKHQNVRSVLWMKGLWMAVTFFLLSLSKMFYNKNDTNSTLFYKAHGITKHNCVTYFLTTHDELMPGWQAVSGLALIRSVPQFGHPGSF